MNAVTLTVGSDTESIRGREALSLNVDRRKQFLEDVEALALM